MTAAFVEHRPLATDISTATTHHVVIADYAQVHQAKTQKEAADWAIANGYKPVHVARERHLQNRDRPDHWRHYQ
jgi:hypothetical protein